MKMQELTHEERVALLGLLKAVTRADDELSVKEADELKKLVAQMGRELFLATAREAQERFRSVEEVKAFAAEHVKRQAARELIFSVCYDVALLDEFVPEEQRVLDWMAASWDLYPPEGEG